MAGSKTKKKEEERERPLVAASRLFTHCANTYCDLVRSWSPEYADVDIAIMLVKENDVEMTRTNDGCLDSVKSDIKRYLKERLARRLNGTDPVMILELLKYDYNGRKLAQKDRGMIIEGERYRVYLGLIGFKQGSYLDLQEMLHGRCFVLDSPFILFKEHYAHY